MLTSRVAARKPSPDQFSHGQEVEVAALDSNLGAWSADDQRREGLGWLAPVDPARDPLRSGFVRSVEAIGDPSIGAADPTRRGRESQGRQI